MATSEEEYGVVPPLPEGFYLVPQEDPSLPMRARNDAGDELELGPLDQPEPAISRDTNPLRNPQEELAPPQTSAITRGTTPVMQNPNVMTPRTEPEQAPDRPGFFGGVREVGERLAYGYMSGAGTMPLETARFAENVFTQTGATNEEAKSMLEAKQKDYEGFQPVEAHREGMKQLATVMGESKQSKDSSIRGGVMGGIESLGAMLGAASWGAIGGVKAAFEGVNILFGGSQANETYERLITEGGVDPKTAALSAVADGAVTYGVEKYSNALFANRFLRGMGVDLGEGIAKGMNIPQMLGADGWKGLVKNLGKQLGTELLEEEIQGGFSAWIRKAVGDLDEDWNNFTSLDGQTRLAIGTLVATGIFAGSTGMYNKYRGDLTVQALTDPATDPKVKLMIANNLYNAIKDNKEVAPLAEPFRAVVFDSVMNNTPVPIDMALADMAHAFSELKSASTVDMKTGKMIIPETYRNNITSALNRIQSKPTPATMAAAQEDLNIAMRSYPVDMKKNAPKTAPAAPLTAQEQTEQATKPITTVPISELNKAYAQGLQPQTKTTQENKQWEEDYDTGIAEREITQYSMKDKPSENVFTPESVTQKSDLPEGAVFVFGSNTQGRHGKGAAKVAKEQFGAILGRASGRQGNSFAIVTKDLTGTKPKEEILNEVKSGLFALGAEARSNPQTPFYLTRIGTGLAGLSEEEIKKQVASANLPGNVILPKGWERTPTEKTLFQLAATNPDKPEPELRSLVLNFLKRNKFDVSETTTPYLHRLFKKDVVAATDMINRMVMVATDRENIHTLPEEAGHVFWEFYKVLKDRGSKALDDYEIELAAKRDPGFLRLLESVRFKYGQIPGYIGNDEKIMDEAIGQLIGQHVVKEYRDLQKNSPVWKWIQNIIDRVLQNFEHYSRVLQALVKLQSPRIENIYGKSMTDFAQMAAKHIISGTQLLPSWETEGENYNLYESLKKIIPQSGETEKGDFGKGPALYSFIIAMESAGFNLGGSAGISRYGKMVRDKKLLPHDLDFNIKKETKFPLEDLHQMVTVFFGKTAMIPIREKMQGLTSAVFVKEDKAKELSAIAELMKTAEDKQEAWFLWTDFSEKLGPLVEDNNAIVIDLFHKVDDRDIPSYARAFEFKYNAMRGKDKSDIANFTSLLYPNEKMELSPLLDKTYYALVDKPGKYEVSSAGDKRFSALYAKLKDGRTIEEAYQIDIKGYSSVKEGKGKPPKTSMSREELWQKYKALWKQWATENPELIEDLRTKSKGKTLTDKFAKTEISQARALTEILAETESQRDIWKEVSLSKRELQLREMESQLTDNQKKEKALLLSISTIEQQIGKLLDEKSEDTDTTVSLLSKREEMYEIFRKMIQDNTELSKQIVILKDTLYKESKTAEEDTQLREVRQLENSSMDKKYRALFLGFTEVKQNALAKFHRAYNDMLQDLGWSFTSSLENITSWAKSFPVKVNKQMYSDLLDATRSAVTEKALRDYDYKSVQELLKTTEGKIGHKEVEKTSKRGIKYVDKVPLTWGDPTLAKNVWQIYKITSNWLTRNGLWSYMRHVYEGGPEAITYLSSLYGQKREDKDGLLSLDKTLFEEVVTTWARAEALMESFRTGREKKFFKKRPLMAGKKIMRGKRTKDWAIFGTYRLLDKDGTILSSFRAPFRDVSTENMLSFTSMLLDAQLKREYDNDYSIVEKPSQKKPEIKEEEKEKYPGEKKILDMLKADAAKGGRMPERRLTTDVLQKIFNPQNPFITSALKEGLIKESDVEDAKNYFFFNDPFIEYREQTRPTDIGDTGITEDEAAEFRRSLDAGQVFSPGEIGEGFEVFTEENYFSEDDLSYLQGRLADVSDSKVIQDTIAEMREISDKGFSLLLGRKIEDYKWRKYTEIAVERAIIKISKILEDTKDTLMGKAIGIQSVLLDLTQEQSIYLAMVADTKGIAYKTEFMLAKELMEGSIDQNSVRDIFTNKSFSEFSRIVKSPGTTTAYRRLFGNNIANETYPGEDNGAIPIPLLSWNAPENVFNKDHILAQLYSEMKTRFGMEEAMKSLSLFFHTLINLRKNDLPEHITKDSMQKAEWMAYQYSYGYEKIYSGTLMRSFERDLMSLLSYKQAHVKAALGNEVPMESIAERVKSEAAKVLKFITDHSLNSGFLNIPDVKTLRYGNNDPVGAIAFEEQERVLDTIEQLSEDIKTKRIDILSLSKAENNWDDMKRRTDRIMELSERVKDRSITRKELDELQRETDIAYLDNEMIFSGSALSRQFNDTVSPLSWKSAYMRNKAADDFRHLFLKRGDLFNNLSSSSRSEVLSELAENQMNTARKEWKEQAEKIFTAWKELTAVDRDYYESEIPLINEAAAGERRMFKTKEVEYADLLDVVNYIDMLEMGIMTELERLKASNSASFQSATFPIIDVEEAYAKAREIFEQKLPRTKTAELLLREAVGLIDHALSWQGAKIKYKSGVSTALMNAVYGAKQLTRLVPKILTSDQKLNLIDKIIDELAVDLSHVSPGKEKGKQREMYNVQEENMFVGEALTNMGRIFGTVQFPSEAGVDSRLWGTISIASHLRKEARKHQMQGIPTPLTNFWAAIQSLQNMKLGDKRKISEKSQTEINKYAKQLKIAVRQMQNHFLDYNAEAMRKVSEDIQYSMTTAVKEYSARESLDTSTLSEAAGSSMAAVATVINRLTGGKVVINFVSPLEIAEGYAKSQKKELEDVLEQKQFFGSFQMDMGMDEAAGLIKLSLLNTEDEMWDTAFHESYHAIERMIQILSKYADNPEVRRTFSDLLTRLPGDPEQAAINFAAMFRAKTTMVPQKSRLAVGLIKQMLTRLKAFIKSLVTGLSWRNQLTLDKVKTFSQKELMDFFFSGEFATLFNQQKLSTSLYEARQALLSIVTQKYAYQLAYEDNPSEMESGKEYTYMSVPEKYQRVYEDVDPDRPVSFVWSGLRAGEQIWYFTDTMEPLDLNDSSELAELFNQDTQYSMRDIGAAIRRVLNTPSPTASSRYDTLSNDWIGNTQIRIKKNANIADRITNLSAQLSRVLDKRVLEGLKLPFTKGVEAARVTLEGSRYLRTVLYYLHDINRLPANRAAYVRLRDTMNSMTKEQFLTRNTGWTAETYDEAKRILPAVQEFESKIATNPEAQRIVQQIYSTLESAYTEIGEAAGELGIINHFIGRYQSRVVQRPQGGKWKAVHTVSVGELFTAEDGKTYRALSSGTTGTTQPSGVGQNIQDGTVRWRFVEQEEDELAGGIGGYRRSTGHAVRRTFRDIVSAWSNGYEIVIDDIASNFKDYADEVSVAIENNLLLRTATGYGLRGQLPNITPAVTDSGELIFSIGEPIDSRTGKSYKLIDNPNFFVWESIDQSKWIDNDSDYKQAFGPDNTVSYYKKKKIYIHPDYSQRFESMMDHVSPMRRNTFFRFLLKYNAELKRIILASSLFHVFAFIRQYWFGTPYMFLGSRAREFRREHGMSMNPFKAWKSGYELIRKLNEGTLTRANLTPEMRVQLETLELLMNNGLTLGNVQDWGEFEELRKEKSVFAKSSKGLKGKAGEVIRNIDGFVRANEVMLFKYFGNGLKVLSSMAMYTYLQRKYAADPEFLNMSAEDQRNKLAGYAAEFANANFGGLQTGWYRNSKNPLTRAWFSPLMTDVKRLVLLAPDWTESNLIAMKKLIPKIGSSDKFEKAAYAYFARSVIARGFTTILLSNILIALIAGASDYDDDDAWERLTKGWSEGDNLFEKLKGVIEVDVTPFYRLLGGKEEDVVKRYNVIGHFIDNIKAVTATMGFFRGKLAALPKAVLDGLYGANFKGETFTTFKEVFGIDYDKGRYLRTTGTHKAGDPKWGKYFMEPTKFGEGSSVTYDTFLSYLMYETKAVGMPIQIQEMLNVAFGYSGWFEALARMGFGQQVSSTYLPKKEAPYLSKVMGKKDDIDRYLNARWMKISKEWDKEALNYAKNGEEMPFKKVMEYDKRIRVLNEERKEYKLKNKKLSTLRKRERELRRNPIPSMPGYQDWMDEE